MKSPIDEANQTLFHPSARKMYEDEKSPLFEEPWQAQAFALAVSLSEVGLFSWQEWSEELGKTITQAQETRDPDLGNTYYKHWLKTLERLLSKKEVLDQNALHQRKKIWEEAYLKTPHGQPVEIHKN